MTDRPDHERQPGAGPRRRRVILVSPGFSAAEDDWCIPILRDFGEGLAKTNDVSVIALRYPARPRRYRVGGLDTVALGGGTCAGLSKLGLLRRAIATVAREARRRSADVIHAFWAHEPGVVAGIAGRWTRVPVVVTVMGGELAALPGIGYGGGLTPAMRIQARLGLGLSDRVVALSRVVAEIAGRRVEPERLRRLDFGVRTDRFHPRAAAPSHSSNGAVRLLCVGSLVPVKGHEVLLRAFARCHAELPGTSLELVGEGTLEDELRRLVHNLGVGPAVRFTGAVDHSQLADRYHAADLLVVSSWWEGASQVAREALACGLPVVGTAVGVLPELGDAACCVPVGDTEALAREMVRVAASVEIRSSMAAAAVQATRPFTHCISDHERLYDSVRRHDPRSNRQGRDG